MAAENNVPEEDETEDWSEFIAWQKADTEAHNTRAALARASGHCVGSEENVKPPRLNKDGSEYYSLDPKYRTSDPKYDEAEE